MTARSTDLSSTVIEDDAVVTGSAFESDLVQLMLRLFSQDVNEFRNHVQLSPSECLSVCNLSIEMLKTRKIYLQLQSPVNIVGDLHGQFHDLLRLFDALGKPPESNYLFLGDYVDRGKFSLEVIMLLLCLMLLHPGSVHLLRGNHETASVFCRYGFRAEILQRYPKSQAQKVLSGFTRVFQWLPLCAIIDGRTLCAHGGVSPSFLLPPFDSGAGRTANLAALCNNQRRPLEPKRASLCLDLLWSDPVGTLSAVYMNKGEEAREPRWVANSKRQCSFMFSAVALQLVMRVFRTQMLVRGHQLAQTGFKASHDKHCITLFSAPGYCGTQNNSGAVLQVLPTSTQAQDAGTFFIMKPLKRDQDDLNCLFWQDLGDAS